MMNSTSFVPAAGSQAISQKWHAQRQPNFYQPLYFQRGMNLIELMVGLALSMFLLLGLFSIFDTTRQTYTAQTGLAEIQEKQRNAIALLSGTIQSAGYFPVTTGESLNPDPILLRNKVFPVISGTYAAGSPVFGTEGGANSDTIRIRFQTASGDNIPNCQGNSNTTGSNVIYDNAFSVTANNKLACAIGTNGGVLGSSVDLIDGVSDLQVLYGIDTTGLGSTTQYVQASSISDWTKVRSIKLTLTFTNPNAQQAGQAATLNSTQVIQLMGNP